MTEVAWEHAHICTSDKGFYWLGRHFDVHVKVFLDVASTINVSWNRANNLFPIKFKSNTIKRICFHIRFVIHELLLSWHSQQMRIFCHVGIHSSMYTFWPFWVSGTQFPVFFNIFIVKYFCWQIPSPWKHPEPAWQRTSFK